MLLAPLPLATCPPTTAFSVVAVSGWGGNFKVTL